jgi:hypothetical protein
MDQMEDEVIRQMTIRERLNQNDFHTQTSAREGHQGLLGTSQMNPLGNLQSHVALEREIEEVKTQNDENQLDEEKVEIDHKDETP